jgi:hypothetical protein
MDGGLDQSLELRSRWRASSSLADEQDDCRWPTMTNFCSQVCMLWHSSAIVSDVEGFRGCAEVPLPECSDWDSGAIRGMPTVPAPIYNLVVPLSKVRVSAHCKLLLDSSL